MKVYYDTRTSKQVIHNPTFGIDGDWRETIEVDQTEVTMFYRGMMLRDRINGAINDCRIKVSNKLGGIIEFKFFSTRNQITQSNQYSLTDFIELRSK